MKRLIYNQKVALEIHSFFYLSKVLTFKWLSHRIGDLIEAVGENEIAWYDRITDYAT